MGDENELEVSEALPKYERLYTVKDYHSWDEGFRCELYEGTLIVAETPAQRHQKILMEISGQLWQFLKDKPCKVYPAPFAVRLSEKEETVFEPDIVVICDESKLGGRIFSGAPDFIAEILSPSTARMDKKQKFQKYQQAGVKEYWIVNPDLNILEANTLKDGSYITMIFNESDMAPIHTINFEINLADVFAE
jgi:Uma2 family endonuclease